MITQKENKIRTITTVLETFPEYALDEVLKLLQEEEITSLTGKNVIGSFMRRQIVIPPINQKTQRVRRTPIKVGGKPLSEIIIEDRR